MQSLFLLSSLGGTHGVERVKDTINTNLAVHTYLLFLGLAIPSRRRWRWSSGQ